MIEDDPALEAVRKARCDISRELGNDPARLLAHYANLQAHFKGRLIRGPEAERVDVNDIAQPAAAADLAPRGGRAA